MKKPIKTLFLGLALGGMVAFTSCKQEPKPEDTKEVAEDQNEVKFDDTNEAKEDDSEFLVAAAETHLEEIEIGKLAQAKGTDPEVKKFGQMLVDDHTKATTEVKALAAQSNISLPVSITEKGQEAYDKLNNEKTGKDFDRKFADMMVNGHEKAIEKMKDASEKANDPAVRDWAARMIPTLQAHLGHAKTLQDKIKTKN